MAKEKHNIWEGKDREACMPASAFGDVPVLGCLCRHFKAMPDGKTISP